MAEQKFVNLSAIQHYDEKIKAYLAAEDAKTLQAMKDFGETAYDPAGTAESKVQELANGTVKANSEALTKLNGDVTVEGSVAKAVADAKSNLEGQISTVSGKADAAQGAADAAQDAADAAQGDVDALAGKVGAVPEGSTVMGIITNIQENAYDDTELRGLIDDNTEAINGVKATAEAADALSKENKAAIEVLNGEGEGSVKKSVDDALNKFATDVTNDNVVNSYKELVDYVAEHGPEAAEMAGNIAANAEAIEAVEDKLGALPEGTADVVSYVDAQVGAEQQRAEGIEAGLESRLQVVEGKLGEGTDGVGAQIEAAKQAAIEAAATDATTKANKALEDSKAYTDAEIDKVEEAASALTERVGANETAISGLTTRMGTAESDVSALKTAVETTLPQAIAEAKAAGTNAQAKADENAGLIGGLTTRVGANETSLSAHGDRLTSLEAKVGDGFTPVTNSEIDAMFA